MRTKSFGSLNEQVPVIGQGTWKLSEDPNGLEQAAAALKAGIEIGMVHIDTAEMYGDGQAEKTVASAIKGFPREQLFIVSKVLPANASYEGTIAACDRSLQRLQTDYIDCYLLHWRGPHPVGDTMQAMEELVDNGKIRSIGVSNFDIEDLEEAQQALTRHRIVCDQVLYHLWDRGIEKALIPYCAQRSIAVTAYTPFGQKQPPAPDSNEGKVLSEMARKYGASVRQIMLAFLVREDNVFAIPKASSLPHLKDNAGAGDILLEPEDVSLIGNAFPAPRSRVPLSWF